MKKAVLWLTIIIVVLALTGCSKSSQSGSGSGASNNFVRIATDNGQYGVWFNNLKAEAERATGLQIDFVVPALTGLEAMLTEVASGGASEIDAWHIDGPLVPELADKGAIIPIDKWMKAEDIADFFDVSIETVTHDGKIYAYPYITHGLNLFYNRDMLEAANVAPPTTLDEIVAASIKLTDASKGIYGFAVEGFQSAEPVGHLIDTILRFGGSGLVDRNMQISYGDQATIDAYIWLHDMIYKHQCAPPESAGWHNGDTAAALQQGKVAMIFNWPYLYYESKDPSSTAESIVGRIGVVPAPKTACVWSWVWGMMATSKRQDNAFKFMEWACSPDSVYNFSTTLLVPVARKSVYDRITNSNISPSDKDAILNLTRTVENGFSHPLPTDFGTLRLSVAEYLSRIMSTRNIDIAAEVRRSAAVLREIHTENGY